MERFLDLTRRDEVIQRVLHEWLLRELRDELASRLTWSDPGLHPHVGGLRVRPATDRPVEIYFLTPVGIGGKFFYEHPVGEALYSAEAQVVVGLESESVRVQLGQERLFWVGSDEPRGYRISEGFDALFEQVLASLTKVFPGSRRAGEPGTRRGSRPRAAA